MGTKLKLVEIAAVGVVGYIAYTKISGAVNILPNGLKGISDWWNSLWTNTVFGGTKKFQWITSKDVVKQGETFSIYAFGMPPGQQFIYGWTEIGNIFTGTADANGQWFSPDIVVTVAPGTYHVYLDLSPFGGDKTYRTIQVTS